MQVKMPGKLCFVSCVYVCFLIHAVFTTYLVSEFPLKIDCQKSTFLSNLQSG